MVHMNEVRRSFSVGEDCLDLPVQQYEVCTIHVLRRCPIDLVEKIERDAKTRQKIHRSCVCELVYESSRGPQGGVYCK